MSEPVKLYECGICSCLHPWNWDGDCREDANRYGTSQEYAEKHGISDNDIEVYSWEDRQAADTENV